MNISSASVPRAHRHHHHRQQQQQTTTLIGSPGPASYSVSAPATPKGRQEGARRQARRPISFNAKIGASPCYAGSKFSDSPTARAIPLPPTEWIYEAFSSSSQSDTSSMSSGSFVGANSDSETSSICSSTPSWSDVGEMSALPTTPQKSALRPPSGMRVHPLRLIAAVAAS
ncbi:unnamed protein product [Strongylus vulgaris]|uniref:Uncharacterized protein n=1 Tax=Strongylus vulgaris TaxID=40348 RepID=A0A3P7I577_STRVU|nr:unnamed protein product [Strongylus vulgaris]